MLEFFQTIPILADIFILATMAILLIFGFHGLCWPKDPRPYARPADPRYAQLLRK